MLMVNAEENCLCMLNGSEHADFVLILKKQICIKTRQLGKIKLPNIYLGWKRGRQSDGTPLQ